MCVQRLLLYAYNSSFDQARSNIEGMTGEFVPNNSYHHARDGHQNVRASGNILVVLLAYITFISFALLRLVLVYLDLSDRYQSKFFTTSDVFL